MAALSNNCGSESDRDRECPDLSPAKSNFAQPKKSNPALILIFAIPGLLFFPLAILSVILGVRHRENVRRGLINDSRIAQLGFVLGAAGIIVGSLQLIIMLYLIPVLIGPGIAENETETIKTLRTIHEAQIRYIRLTGDYSPSIELLRERGFVSLDPLNHGGYIFKLTVPEGIREFELRAHPLKPGTTGQRHFYINHSGIIRYAENGDVGLDSPRIDSGST